VEDSRPRYSPDGASIVYGTQKDPDFYADRVRLVRFDRKTGTHTVLTEEWDRSAAGWEFDGAGRLVFLAEDRGRTSLFTLPLAGGTPALLREDGVPRLPDGGEGPPLLHAARR